MHVARTFNEWLNVELWLFPAHDSRVSMRAACPVDLKLNGGRARIYRGAGICIRWFEVSCAVAGFFRDAALLKSLAGSQHASQARHVHSTDISDDATGQTKGISLRIYLPHPEGGGRLTAPASNGP